jgi:hypothetical protein
MYKYGWIKNMLKNTMKKKVFYNISKDQSSQLGSPKNEKAEKT